MELELRAITADELAEFVRVVWTAFGEQPNAATVDAWAAATEVDRTAAAFDGDQMVATSGAFTMQLTVPGGAAVPVGGLTVVGVLPTHRRRGILRELMRRHLDDVAARGEVASVLTASSSAIYGRFGYGPATFLAERELETCHAGFSASVDEPGRMRLLDRDAALTLLPALHDRARRERHGEVDRSPSVWRAYLADLDGEATEGRPWFFAVHEAADGAPDGFAVYRVAESSWPSGLARNHLHVWEVSAASPGVHAAIWRYLLDIDLVERVSTRSAAVDDPLRWRLRDPRRLRTTAIADHLWLRLIDVPSALSARTFGEDGALTLEVREPSRPQRAGHSGSDAVVTQTPDRYRLEVAGGAGTCEPTGAAPDLVADVSGLGSIYLGGVSIETLRRAGRVQELRRGAVAEADRLFRTPVAPHCTTPF